MLGTLLLIVHILVAVLICIVILMQSAKGEGLSGAFGLGQGTSSFFGADTANVLVRITTVLAVVFMLTSLSLAYIQARNARSVTRGPAAPTESSMTAPPGEKTEDEGPEDGQPEDEGAPGGTAPVDDEPADAGGPTGVGEDEPATEPETGGATEEVTPSDAETEPGEPDEPDPEEPGESPNTES